MPPHFQLFCQPVFALSKSLQTSCFQFALSALPGHNTKSAVSSAALCSHQCVLAHKYGTHRADGFKVRSRAPGRAMSCFCTAHRSLRTGAALRSASPGATARASWRRTTTPSPTTTAPTSSPFLVRDHTPLPAGLSEWLLLCLVHGGDLHQHVPQPLPHMRAGRLWCVVSPLFPARSCDHCCWIKTALVTSLNFGLGALATGKAVCVLCLRTEDVCHCLRSRARAGRRRRGQPAVAPAERRAVPAQPAQGGRAGADRQQRPVRRRLPLQQGGHRRRGAGHHPAVRWSWDIPGVLMKFSRTSCSLWCKGILAEAPTLCDCDHLHLQSGKKHDTQAADSCG